MTKLEEAKRAKEVRFERKLKKSEEARNKIKKIIK
jgi:hypothetical protein